MILDATLLESRVQSLGEQIFKEISKSSLSLLDSEFYTGKLLNWAMEDEDFKVSLFRFVDVFPALGDSSAIVRHAQEYFTPVAERIPSLLKWGLRVDPNSISAKISAPIIGHQIRSLASRFIVGETPEQALKGLRQIRKNRMAFTVDLLGEASLSEQEARVYVDRYDDLLRTLAREVPAWPESRPILEGHKGEVSPINISVKLSALYSQARPVASKHSLGILADRFAEILALAKSVRAVVFLDMEDTAMTSLTLDVFREVLTRPEFRDYDRVGIVLQSYLRRTEDDFVSLIKWARLRGGAIGVRLVKGAYWDTETILAEQRHWPVPVWQDKAETDAAYERLALKLLENHEFIVPAFASHNLRSLCVVAATADMLKVPTTDYELQALYGMAEPIKKAFVDRGFLVRDYAPIGELIPGMSYLVRRLLENTSNEGFLRQNFYEQQDVKQLLGRPKAKAPKEPQRPAMREQFQNSPLRDFSEANVRAGLADKVETFKTRLRIKPEVVAPMIAGRYWEGEKRVSSVCPEEPALKVADVVLADRDAAEKAVTDLWQYFPQWRDRPVRERAEVLFRAAEHFEKQRDEITAVIVLEAGKPWLEADADVAEAIDFCVYYAHEALRISAAQRMGKISGEYNSYFYEPRGLTVVISPWNFPLAIPCGMFAASVVTGNATLLKPSLQTPLVARYLFDTFLAAGLPERAACFLPSSGREVGMSLVRHPLVSTIAFTGSKEVGLEIIKAASVTSPSAWQVKRVIAEMGGKNAVIIDDGADLDEAVRGVVYSAFGYSGQKCSACSRVIVVGHAYDRFLGRLREAVRSLVVGPASDPATFMGPVVEENAMKRIRDTVESAKKDCRIVIEGASPLPPAKGGYYVQPVVFDNIPPNHPLLRDEIFGPVLAVIRAKDFDEALNVALDSEFALTGGLYSRSPANIRKAVEKFRVGNLYINRPCTGALVMRQPFGGFRMSGVGSKAGGPDYLLQFVVPRSVSENTMRRGFAPKL